MACRICSSILIAAGALALAAHLVAADAPAPQAREYLGTVTLRTPALVRLQLESAEAPAPGTAVTVSAFFRKNIFGMDTTGWLVAARARVTAAQGDSVTLAVLEEKSAMTVNGKKVDHLTVGTRVKLTAP